MISFNALLRISAYQLRDNWKNFARKAYVEPVVIEDGFHTYVLLSADEFKALTTGAGETSKTPD